MACDDHLPLWSGCKLPPLNLVCGVIVPRLSPAPCRARHRPCPMPRSSNPALIARLSNFVQLLLEPFLRRVTTVLRVSRGSLQFPLPRATFAFCARFATSPPCLGPGNRKDILNQHQERLVQFARRLRNALCPHTRPAQRVHPLPLGFRRSARPSTTSRTTRTASSPGNLIGLL